MYITKIDRFKDKIKNIITDFHKNNNTQMISVIYLPGFDEQDRFEDQYLRLIWYIHPIIDSIENIFIPINSATIDTKKRIVIPSYLDQNILEFEYKIKNKIKYFDQTDLDQWESNLKKSQISLVWDTEYKYEDRDINKTINDYKKLMRNWRVDHNNVQSAASFFLKFSSEANQDSEKDLKESQDIFNHFVQKIALEGFEKVYIFGTGPSLDEASRDTNTFDDSITIACNSMVKNQELLKKLKPRLFVASDPIFHAGCSAYAEEFRKNLFISMDTFPESILVVPFRDFVLYRQNLPAKFYKRIVGIPFEHLENTNFDITETFKVKSTGNVMTNLLIPLATTMAKEVYMMGYDGRKIEDNQYYWDHNKKAQFNEQMESIQVAHPSFFTVDYDDYYFEHCETLEKIFTSGEEKGYAFINQAHSYIPALVKRNFSNYSQDCT